MSISLLIATGNVSTRGNSSTADTVATRAELSRSYLQNSCVLGLRGKGVFDELWRVVQERQEWDWDGYGAVPVSEQAYQMAFRFLEALPLGTGAPAIGCEPDGHITLEWYRTPRRTLSVSVSPEGELHYAALLPGPRKAFGTEQFVGDIPANILSLITDITAE